MRWMPAPRGVIPADNNYLVSHHFMSLKAIDHLAKSCFTIFLFFGKKRAVLALIQIQTTEVLDS
eukprot:scaffold221128_cov23-Attheya_sp.AAC.2